MVPLDSRKAGESNEWLILSYLRDRGQLSQKELCALTQLGSSTVSSIVTRLREKEMIVETQGKSHTRGPKPVLLAINRVGRYLVGAELNPAYVRLGLFDFHTAILDHIQIPLASTDVEHVTQTLTTNVLDLLNKHDIHKTSVLGIGVTISGTISADGVVELSSTFGWKHVPLQARLTHQLGFAVHIFTTRVRLLAELSLTGQDQYSNALYLNVADGVSCNVIAEGHLFHGSSHRSGEIGHVIVDPAGPLCGCGHRGCLEALVGGPALARRIQQDLADGAGTVLRDLVNERDNHRTIISTWGLAIRQKDAYALRLQQEVISTLAWATAIAINLYDPAMVVLAGYVCDQCQRELADAIKASFDTQVYDGQARSIPIRPAKAADERYILGAVIGVLQQQG